MKVERINQLFEEGIITTQEHQFLIKKLYASNKVTSIFAWASLWSASFGWLLMLKFTVNGREYALSPSEHKLSIGVISGLLGLAFYYLARRDIKNSSEVSGGEIAARGQAISLVILSLIIPVLLLTLFSGNV
jgi:hypothetical protein